MALLKAIRFHNYKAFKDAELPLEPLTVLIGPNGSGKTSALSAIPLMAAFVADKKLSPHSFVPIGLGVPIELPSLSAVWDNNGVIEFTWRRNGSPETDSSDDSLPGQHLDRLRSGRIFTLEPTRIAEPVQLTKTLEIQENGSGLPAVLTTLQDQSPERFETLNLDLRRWLPEFDRILFDTPSDGHRAIELRTSIGGHVVPTSKLSAGTLLSLTLLSICHLPTPPAIIGLEEPDYGIHPRLLRNLKDCLLRLTDPQSFGDKREPAQVIISTHSPYLVDLFRDELDSIVVTQKKGLYATFSRLSDLPHVDEIVKDAALGEAWYSGLLGGVPVES